MTQTFQEQANREVRNKRPVWKIFQIYAVVPRLFARAPSPFHNVYFLQTILHPRWVTYFLNAPICEREKTNISILLLNEWGEI